MANRHFFYYPDSSVVSIIIYRLRIIVLSLARQLHQFLYYRHFMLNSKDLEGTKRGQNAFVFACGGSMNNIDPIKIKAFGYDIIAVNGYLLSDFGSKIPPTHYVLSDPSWFNGSVGNDRYRDAERNDKVINLLANLNAKLFVPLNYIKYITYKELYGFCDIENSLSTNVVNIGKPRGYNSVTAYKALAIALYLGYDHIYICGIDNNYLKYLEVDSSNRLSYAVPHIQKSTRVYLDADGFCATVGEYMYRDHKLFEDLRKFPHSRITNLDSTSLICEFNKRHDLDIYLDDKVS